MKTFKRKLVPTEGALIITCFFRLPNIIKFCPS